MSRSLEKEAERAKRAKAKIKEKGEKAKAKMAKDHTAKAEEKAKTREEKTAEKEENPKEKEKMVIIEVDQHKRVNLQQVGHLRDYQIDHYANTSRTTRDVKQERIARIGILAHAKHFKVATALMGTIVFSFMVLQEVIIDAEDHLHQEGNTAVAQEDILELLMKVMMNGMRIIGKRTTMTNGTMINGKTTNGMKMTGTKLVMQTWQEM